MKSAKDRSWFGRLLACLAMLVVVACGAGRDDASAGHAGTLRLPLSARGSNGTTYRLRQAEFSIAGAGSTLALSSESFLNQSTIDVSLAPGSYTITLADGWFLERKVGGNFQVVSDATLTSSDVVDFDVVGDATTTIVFRFAVNKEVIDLGGSVSIGIGVDEVDGGTGGQNAPPAAADDAFAVTAGGTLDVAAPGVLANDTDPEGEPLTAALDVPAAFGAVTLNSDGSFTYQNTLAVSTQDTFTYLACDPEGLCDTAEVVISIGPPPANQPPAAADDAFAVTAGGTLDVAAPGVLANDTDPEGEPLTAVLDVPAAFGAVTLNSDGSFTYQNTLAVSTQDTFTYLACDPEGLCDTAEVVISIGPPPANQPPAAADDAFAVTAGGTLDVAAPGVLANDTDPEGEPLTAVLDVPAAFGAVTLNSDGSFTYQNTLAVSTQDTFTYLACDPEGLCDTAEVVISIGPAP